jgi:enoyl-CoA hydratase/carnithine racemase
MTPREAIANAPTTERERPTMSKLELDCATWTVEDGVGVLTLNRPDRLNALSDDLLSDLDRVLVQAKARDDVRAVVITGAGRGFSSGADVQNWASGEDAELAEPWPPKMHRVMSRLYWLPKPVVAAVNGVAGLRPAVRLDQRPIRRGVHATGLLP